MFQQFPAYLYGMLELLENLSKDELVALISQQHEQTQKLEKQTQKLEKKAEALEDENRYLTELVAKLQRLIFAQKRERFTDNPGQLPLPFQMSIEEQRAIAAQTAERLAEQKQQAAQQQQDKEDKKAASKKHPGRIPLPEHLPVEEITIEPEADTADMVCIGTETTDQLEYRPAGYYIRRYIRPKYAPKKDVQAQQETTKIIIAPLPEFLIPKGIAGPGLVASVLVDKYADHLPLYRQLQRFKRENIPIAASTLEGWTRQGLQALDTLYHHLLKHTRAKGYLQADESPIKVQDKDKKGSCHQGYYWVYHCPLDGTVLFDYQPGRGSGAAAHVLEGFKGFLQSDGYAVYDKIGMREEVTHVGCWAHARREFHNALLNDKDRASIALGFIQSLYKVEADAREAKMSAAQRKELRLERSLPVLNAFGKWLADELKTGNILPKSAIGKAITYTVDRWDKLSAYLYDGSLEIDNNLVENAIRPLALGRKNYLFAGSHEAAKRAACIYSFFAMCRKEVSAPATPYC